MAANIAKKKILSSADVKQRERLAYLEALLVWRGRISRVDLTKRFATSLSHASEDFKALREIHKGGIVRGKFRAQQCVMATEKFAPVFLDPGALGCAGALVGGAWTAITTTPSRRGNPAVETTLARAAVNGLEVDMLYHSVASGASTWRKVAPLRFIDNGSRWYVRGFCFEDLRFKDYVLNRIEKVRLGGQASVMARQDKDWAKFTSIVLRPRRGLSARQLRALVSDHGMKGGKLTIKVRRPLAFYVLHHFGLLPGFRHPHLELISPRVGTPEHAEITRHLANNQSPP